MARLFTKKYNAPGTAPGTLREADTTPATPQTAMMTARWRLTRFDEGRWETVADARIKDVFDGLDGSALHWIDIQGTPSASELFQLGERLGLHPLALEDVLNGGQRPKVEKFSDVLTVTLGIPSEDGHDTIAIHQLSLFMGRGFVLSIVGSGNGAAHDDPFGEIRRRLSVPGARPGGEADDLVYALIDAAVDHAFPVLDTIGERIEAIEQEILDRPDKETLEDLHAVKRELIVLRRHLWPTRDVVNQLLRDHADLFTGETLLWMRDVYDHTVQIMDLVESYRDMTASLLDVYLSSMSNRLNESMRALTVIATIFMPLTFIVGIYGMNFENPDSPYAMPELGWYWGYPLVWLVMLGVIVAMIWMFRRLRWF